MLREIDRTGGISFTRFYAHRIRRLLPPAALVLVLTVVLARLTGSLLQFRSTALDTVLTAGYLFNYRLAEQGVNYQNLAGPQSPCSTSGPWPWRSSSTCSGRSCWWPGRWPPDATRESTG